MSGYEDRSKIKAAEYEVYIAVRTNPNTPVTLPLQSVITSGGDATWKPAGAYKHTELKYKAEPQVIDIQGVRAQQLAVIGTLEFPPVETGDDTKLTLLEGFVNETVDILCRERGSFEYVEYLGFGIAVGSDDPMNVKDANKITVKATAAAKLASALRVTGELAAS